MTPAAALEVLLRGRAIHRPTCDCPWCEATAVLLAATQDHARAREASRRRRQYRLALEAHDATQPTDAGVDHDHWARERREFRQLLDAATERAADALDGWLATLPSE